MAVKLLQVLLLGVIAAAADDDVPIRWVPSPRAALQCEVPNFERIPVRRPPPPLEGDVKPRPKPYIWRKGNEEVRRVNPNGTLEVARKRDADAAGVYQCQARYQSGYVLGYPFHLKFAYIDKQFSAHPSNASVWRGQPYVLSCSIASGPAAVITWLKDGEPVAGDGRYYALNNQLLITAVSDEDAGLYKCRATNPVLNKVRTSHAGRLQVDDSPDFIERAFVPMHHEENIEVEKDSRIVLPCPMFGNPRPKLLWHFTPPGARRAEWDFVDEVLVLPRARPDHDGLYECRDDRNDQLLKTFNVTVTEAINITHAPESKQSVRASTVRFNCTATGKPTPKITWYKDGEEIKYAGRIDLVLSADDKRLRQLLIRSVTTEDAGVYQCVARSGARAESRWSWLEVVGAEAAAPRALACAPAAQDRVRVAWTSVPADVVAYTVLTTSPDGNSLPDSPVEKTENTIKVKSPLTPYGFQVRAYIRSPSNKQNMANVVSDISEKVYCQGQGVPIKLAKEDDGSILVSWWQFYKETPGVVQWILQYKLNSNNNTKEHNITLDGNVYNYTLEVPPDDSIQVRVLGTRKLPWLQQDLSLVPWTASSTATNYAGPGEVQAIPEDVEITEVNARNFTVRWRCEQTMPGNYIYFVCVRSMGGNQECQESVVTTAIVRNLQPDTQYEVRVQARLPGKLAGDFSPPIQISTKPEGKGNVRALTYKYVNPSSIRVSWNSDPREYTVRYTDEFNLPQKQWNAVEVVGNTVLLTDLDPTKTLYVFVEGHEPFGHSTRLDIPAQIPEAKDLQYNYTRSGIRVTWKGDGPREVKYSQNLTQTVDKWHSINVTDTSVQITGLDTSLPTFVMVKAPGPSQYNQVLNIAPRPADFYNLYLGIGIGCGLLLLCFLGIAAFCVWQKRKRSRPIRSRRRHSSPNEGTEEEGSEMKNVGGRLANGGGSKDAGEPLLNGHVHITENPSTKTPNGKLWKGRYEGAFDVTRYSEGDSTLETVIDDGPGYSLLDTSRRPEFDTSTNNSTFHFDGSANNSFHKLPDDNMNTAHWEPPAAAPTLQPNG